MQRQPKSAKLLESKEDLLPICVDLDHTLIQTDSLAESVFLMLKSKPWLAFALPLKLLGSRAKLKAWVANHCDLDPVHLPYNKDVFFYLRRMAKRGHPLYLVTGANRKVADAVGRYLGIFDGIYASDDNVNLIGQAKADLLIKRFGEKRFDYIGDSKQDLRVWKHANAATVVSNSTALIADVKNITKVEKVFSSKSRKVRSLIKAIRVHQWVKNVLVFLPVFLAHKSDQPAVVLDAIFAFLSFSFMASTIYVINDLSDLDADRQHDDKKHRPFASGALPLSAAAFLVPVMFLGSITFASLLTYKFWIILCIYVVVTNLYTFYLKRIPMADIIILSSLYSVRLIGGSMVTGIDISPWLTAFTGFLFISLAMIKRCSELLMLRKKGSDHTIGRGYSVVDIPVIISFGTASGYGSILVLALYINTEVAKTHYKSNQLLWFICPLMIYWISRMWFLANRGLINSDPVKFAMTDRTSWCVFAVAAAIWHLASNYFM